MSIRFGVSPIAWINDDMPELGANTAIETIFADSQALGFEGVELGGRFPRDASVLKPLLEGYDLALIGGWYSLNLLTRSAEAEIEALQPHLALLKAMNCDVFIVAECSNAIHCQMPVPLKDTPRLNAAEWVLFGDRLNAVADYIQAQGLRLAYHFHLGTVVERQADVDQFIAHTRSNVGFVVDTGHAALGGVDALALIRSVPERVVHVHTKDIRRPVFDDIYNSGQSFLKGVLKGMFTAPGDGSLDFSALMQALKDIAYSGWIVIEAEQDPAIADPRQYSELGLKTLKAAALNAGLV